MLQKLMQNCTKIKPMSMEIRIVSVGKLQQGYALEGCRMYEERLKHYVKLQIQTVSDVKGQYSEHEKAKVECERLAKAVQGCDQVILLDEGGVRLSSVKMADLFQEKQIRGIKKLGFVVGGASGFTAAFKEEFSSHWRISDLTLPHEMARLILTEQIYRAMTILKGEPYHKGGLG
jgi:23S rRNA (pseudouridine1915-N3)-methyltransferase